MEEPVDQLYFNWLYAKVTLDAVPYHTYYDLLEALHSTEFTWVVCGDDNRAQDGVDLRLDFTRETGIEGSTSWRNNNSSVLEVLIGFSRVIRFETDQPAGEWFWKLIDNLGLSDQYDGRFDYGYFQAVVNTFVWRDYDPDGRGGLFPLYHSPNDQRNVQIWYQFCEYAEENHLV